MHEQVQTRQDVRRRVRGVVFEIAPIFCFTVSFVITHQIAIALPLALAAGIAMCVCRLVRREPVWRALIALGVVGIGSLLALRSGEAADFFLPSLVIHGAMAAANLVLLAAGWPLMGLVTGLVTGEGTGWRRCRVRRSAFAKGSLVLMASPLVLMAVGLPLYLSGQAVALGLVDVFEPFVFTLAVLLGWRVHRRAVGAHTCAGDTCSAVHH